MNRLWRAWSALSDDDRAGVSGLTLCMAGFLVHYVLYSTWFIEDAAITFAFARNAAAGDGFVAWPGGERVEGFSNPTWTLLLTAGCLVGLDPWVAAKLFGALFGVATLPLAWLWGRRLVGPRYAALVPLFLAISPQYVLWAASGLENAIFNFFLAAGCVLLLREMDEGGKPWSALPFSLLAFSRPEAPLYCAVAGLAGFFWMWRSQGPRRTLIWAVLWNVVFLIPFGVWHAWRYWYFAWPFPNTYYAKLGESRFYPLGWHKKGRGWWYLRSYGFTSAQAFLLPIYLIGQTGLRGRRGWVGAGVATLTMVLLAPGVQWPFDTLSALGVSLTWDEPELLVMTRVGWLTLLAALLPWVGWGRDGVQARTLAWWMVCTTLFFAVYSGGDWMAAFRWLSYASLGMAVLLADGICALVRALPPRPANVPARLWSPRALVISVVTPAALGSLLGVTQFLQNVETSPFSVRRRIVLIHDAQRRMHIEHAVNMEVDFGAQMWFTGHELVDFAGLTDVPFAHHNWERPFVREYVYAERKPTFAHVHDSWARKTGIPRFPGWKNYVEMPGTPISPWRTHAGNFVHKRTFTAKQWDGSTRRRVAYDRAVLTGWRAPAGVGVVGHGLYVELGFRKTDHPGPFRALLFLRGEGRITVHELPPGYDLLPPKRWKSDVMIGRHTIPLPDDLPPGRYDLGLVMLTETGVMAPTEPPRTGTTEGPHAYAEGEVRWDGAIQIVDARAGLDAARSQRERIDSTAAEGKCNQAEEAWRLARELVVGHPWIEAQRPTAESAIARCFARRAVDKRAVRAIVKARQWDFRDPEVLKAGALLADEWQQEGDARAERGDPFGAYDAWKKTLLADPTRAWVRRRAESARDKRLGLNE